jgi:hypothetical protein
MVNYSAYWQAQQRKQPDTIPQPQKALKQPKNGAGKESQNTTHGERSSSVTALA